MTSKYIIYVQHTPPIPAPEPIIEYEGNTKAELLESIPEDLRIMFERTIARFPDEVIDGETASITLQV